MKAETVALLIADRAWDKAYHKVLDTLKKNITTDERVAEIEFRLHIEVGGTLKVIEDEFEPISDAEYLS